MSLSKNLKKQIGPIWGLCAPLAIMIALIFFQSNSPAIADSLTITNLNVSTNGATFPSGVWGSDGKVGIGTTTPAYALTIVGDTKTDSVTLMANGNSCYKLSVDAEGLVNRTHVSCYNGTIIGHTMTANGGGTAIDPVISKFGGASGYFPAYSDYLSTPDSSDWDFGTGNFTIEGWFYVTNGSTNGYIASQGQSDLSFSVATYGGGSNPGAYFAVSFDGVSWAYANYATNTLALNQWHHIALVRNGNQFTGYADGVGTNLISSASAVHNSAASLVIGGQNTVGASIIGYLDEVRISKGVARYTSNFTPTDRPFSCQDANTTLLLHMDSSTVFTDSSGC